MCFDRSYLFLEYKYQGAVNRCPANTGLLEQIDSQFFPISVLENNVAFSNFIAGLQFL